MRKEPAIVTVALVVLLTVSARLEAADHYVSPTGNAAWSACVSPDTQCAPAAAFANAVAGDTVYFRSGTYHPAASTGDSPALPAYRPAHSGTVGNPITFRTYPGEAVIIDAYASTQVNGQFMDDCFGAVDVNYIVFDGFTLTGNGGAALGRAYLWHTTGCTLRNLTINGGSTVQTSVDNTDCIRIEYCTNYAVQNCRISSFHQTTNYANTAAIKLYHNTHSAGLNFGYSDVYGVGLIEHCEISDGVTPIYVKSSTDDLTIRYNFIHDTYYGIHVTPAMSGMESDRGVVHDNLVINLTSSTEGAFSSDSDNTAVHGNDWQIYNNTFYHAYAAFSFSAADAGHGWKYYNNISQNMMGTYDLSGQSVASGVECRLAAEDHNQWGTGSIGFEYGRNAGFYRYTSLAAWQASTNLEGGGHPGASDLASDPGFMNASGTLTKKIDFVLASNSPSKGAGRNGSDMGALNIATDVGYSATPVEPPIPPKQIVIKIP